MAEAASPAKGTRPEGAQTERDASRQIREMFTQIAPRYDLLNHLLSLQLDRVWRARAASRLHRILNRSDAVVLDLCCGTGDLGFALSHSGHARIIGADFSHAMLVRARQKGREQDRVPRSSRRPVSAMPFLEADALHLPFADCSFDLVATAFGFRNLANYETGLREVHRILKPGGTLAILEFTEPTDGLLGSLYRWYFRGILPRVGGFISGQMSAYTYLPRSVSRFFRPTELASLMTSASYGSVEFEVWTFGTVAFHSALKVS
jgi:demethylmenaquinone methyltransferase / 2-methoxy-6-polyprenyl-1,4-benzoquinol methylase